MKKKFSYYLFLFMFHKLIKKIATERAMKFLEQAIALEKQQVEDLAVYGKDYKKTYVFNIIQLHIEWLKFQSTLVTEMFQLKKF